MKKTKGITLLDAVFESERKIEKATQALRTGVNSAHGRRIILKHCKVLSGALIEFIDYITPLENSRSGGSVEEKYLVYCTANREYYQNRANSEKLAVLLTAKQDLINYVMQIERFSPEYCI